LHIAYLEQPNCALRALPGLIGGPTLGIRMVLTGPDMQFVRGLHNLKPRHRHGVVTIGNIGSEKKMDYTVIGDPVNLAARLEGLTKEVKRRILVNERVHAAIRKEIPCESLGEFAVKGKREKVPVFAVKTGEEDL